MSNSTNEIPVDWPYAAQDFQTMKVNFNQLQEHIELINKPGKRVHMIEIKEARNPQLSCCLSMVNHKNNHIFSICTSFEIKNSYKAHYKWLGLLSKGLFKPYDTHVEDNTHIFYNVNLGDTPKKATKKLGEIYGNYTGSNVKKIQFELRYTKA